MQVLKQRIKVSILLPLIVRVGLFLKTNSQLLALYNTIANALTSLKSAFNAKLVISIGMDDYIKASFAKVIRKRFDNVQLVNSSLLYTTDLIAEDRVDYTLYRDSLHLAIIGSLAD